MTCAEIIELSPLYLSGRLDPRRMSEFAAHLASCPDCDLDQRVRASILAEQIDDSRVELAIRNRMRTEGTHPRHVPGWAVAAAAVIATVSAGIFSYRTFLQEQTPPVCVAAAQDHQREIVNGDPRPWLSDLAAIQTLAGKQGVPASDVGALSTTGYRLERGRLCMLQNQIFLHLVFTKSGDEFSVYLRPRGAESSLGKAVRETVVGPEDLAYFQSDRVTAVFVSHQAGANVLAFAKAGAKVL